MGWEGSAAVTGGGGEGGVYNPGPDILHHVLDSVLIPLKVGPWDLTITKHVLMMWIVALILIVLLRWSLRRASDPVPTGLRGVFEIFAVFIRDKIARQAIHHHPERFVSYLLSLFFFIFTCNLLGLVPGMATATGNISVTAGLAFMSFVMIQWGGVRQFGLIGHVKNYIPHGVPLWLMPILVPLELMSAFIKPFALCIRLFANMMAGHVVILAFISLIFILGVLAAPVAVAFALFVYFLELLVAALQAYIFTMLTAQFIGLSVHPPH